MNLVFQGKPMPMVDSRLPIQEFHRAIEQVPAGKMFGKIVVEVNS